MKKINLIVLFGIICISSISYGQDTLSIAKVDLWQKVADKNLQIKIADQEFKSAQADYRQSNSLFLPNITASHTAIATNNPLMAFGSKLNQGILTASDFNPELLNNPDRTTNFATKIEILQPIINIDGLYGRQAARAKMNAYSLQTERTKEYLELEVNKSFMELQLAYKAVAVLEKQMLPVRKT
jgi:outer membrane protein TolC